MPMTDAGAIFLAQAAINDSSPTFFNNANAYLGVGNSSTAFSASQTDLQGSSKFRQAMDATYPQRTFGAITFKSTFATGNANFAWQEWGTFNASSSGTMLTRKVESLGTKTSAQTWALTVTVTLAAA